MRPTLKCLPLTSLIVTALLLGCGVAPEDEEALASIDGELSALETAVYDMYGPRYRTDGRMKDGVVIGKAPWGAHEAFPKELPSNFDFYHGARPGRWDGTPGTGRAVSGWGQVFEAEPGTGTYDVRLHAREFQLHFLMKDGRWVELRPNVDDRYIEGGYWNGYFQSQMGATVRDESNNGGGSSASLAPLVKSNHASLHFWWKGWYPRELIPGDAVGVFVSAQLRLIPDRSGVDMSKARFIASVGADNYSSSTYTSQGEAIPAVMQPRMKFITAQWNSFTGTNLTEAQLRANPPPYRAAGGATTAPTVGDPVPSTSTTLVETFNDGQAQGWSHTSGTWSVTGGELRQTAVISDARSLYTGATWNSGFTLKATLLSEYTGSGNAFGVSFNAVDGGQRFDLRLSPTGAVTLERVHGGGRTVLASAKASIGAWKWVNVQVIRQGTKATVKLNGTTILWNVELGSVGAGRVGVFASWNRVRVGEISVH